MASNGIGDSRRLARGSTRQLGSVTEPPKARAGRPLCPAVLFRTLRKRILRWEEDLAKAAQRGRRTNDEVEASEKERKQVTGLAPKPVTPHGMAPRQGRSEGTAWDGKGRRLAKSKRGGHGRGGRVWAAGPASQTRTRRSDCTCTAPVPRGPPATASARSWGHVLATLPLIAPLPNAVLVAGASPAILQRLMRLIP